MSTVGAMYACLVCLDVYSLLNKYSMSVNTPQADARKLQLELFFKTHPCPNQK